MGKLFQYRPDAKIMKPVVLANAINLMLFSSLSWISFSDLFKRTRPFWKVVFISAMTSRTKMYSNAFWFMRKFCVLCAKSYILSLGVVDIVLTSSPTTVWIDKVRRPFWGLELDYYRPKFVYMLSVFEMNRS